MLVDGSPAYVATHTTRGKKKRASRSAETDEADALAYFVQLFKDVDAMKVSERCGRGGGEVPPCTDVYRRVLTCTDAQVSAELERLPSWEARLARTTELVGAAAGPHGAEALAAAAGSFYRKLVIADTYKPAGRLQAPVTLFTARDNYVALDEDYGLRAVCAGPLQTRQLAGSHRSILAGAGAAAIAAHLSDLLAH